MLPRPHALACAFVFVLVFVQVPFLHCSPADSWRGIVRDAAGNPVGMAMVKLVSADSKREYSAATSASGQFAFAVVAAGPHRRTGRRPGETCRPESKRSLQHAAAAASPH